MDLARYVLAAVTSFLAGVFLQGLAGSNWLVLFLLVLALAIVGAATLKGKQDRPFLIFLILAFALLGFFRAVTYFDGTKSEATLWNNLRGGLVSKASAIMPDPEAALFSAMVLGYEKDIPPHLKEAFNRSGTRHVLAISGMNISIVAMMLLNLGLGAGLWRRQAFWLSLLGVVGFVFLVGSPPSAARAGIMSALLLWAKNRGRLVAPWRPVVLAAFLMVAANPKLLMFNIGFQLSFLAVIGIMYFNNFWSRVFGWIPVRSVRNLISLSMAAQTTTWPLILYNFGTVSVVSPLANVFIVPLLNPIMFLGLGFAVFSWWGFAAKLFLWPAWLILKAAGKIVLFFGSLPWASVDLGKGGLVFLFVYYPLLYLLWGFLGRKGLNDARS